MTGQNSTGYANAAEDYWNNGWRGILPLKKGTKFPPPDGRTGYTGLDSSYPDILQWSETHADGNICLRLPNGVVGLDVDAYGSKTGAGTLAEAEKRWGTLPPTVRSTSRDDGVSGIRLYRVPEGTRLETVLTFPDLGLSGFEIIQRHHRYVVCWPSLHPEGGIYQWLDGDGQPASIPVLDELPELPAAWIEGLRQTKPSLHTDLDSTDLGLYNVAEALTDGDPSPAVAMRFSDAVLDLKTSNGECRHDDTLRHVLALLRLGKNGEPGVMRVANELGNLFVEEITRDGSRSRDEATSEYRRMFTNENAARELAQPSADEWVRQMQNNSSRRENVTGSANQDSAGRDDPKVDNEQVSDPPPNIDEDAWQEYIENKILKRAMDLRVDAEAKRRVAAELAPKLVLPPIKDLTTLLAEPDVEAPFRIAEVAPAGGRILLSAQYKSGKTTLIGNMMRSLVDGDLFLGRFEVHTPAENVVLVDNELGEDRVRSWLRDHGIQNTSAVASVIDLRGRAGQFNPLDDHNRAQWAQMLRTMQCDFFIFDCLRPALDSLGLDENHDAGRFLVAFDALMTEAGIEDAIVVHHMGHTGERSRGDSRLQDWPDAIWTVVRENDDPSSARYFKAYGRDVEVPESRLDYETTTRRLTLTGGNRRNSKAEEAIPTIVGVLVADGKGGGQGFSGRQLEQLVEDHPRAAVREGLSLLVTRGIVARVPGARGAMVHRIANPCQECGLPMGDELRTTHLSCAAQDVA